MNENEIKALIEQAAQNMFSSQPNIFDFTSMTGQTEWNLAHHLAVELQKLLPDFDCDIDVTKHSFNNRRPDIIFHTRGTCDNDYLVIEAKYRGRHQDIQDDVNKIHENWFNPPLSYKFGAVVNILRLNEVEVLVFTNS